MPKKRLSDKLIKSLPLPAQGQVIYWDEGLTGFGVRVSQGGSKTFLIVYGANRQKTTIGKYGIVSLADAREEARRLLAEFTLGKTKPLNMTVQDALERYYKHIETNLRDSTAKSYKQILKRSFSLGRVRLSDVTTQEVMRRINKHAKYPAVHAGTFAVIRAFLKWCVRQHYLEKSPLDGLQIPKGADARSHILTAKELPIVYRAGSDYGYPYGTIVQLLMLTGQRRKEIASLERDWINTTDKTITLPASVTKNKKDHTFPYGDMVHDVLQGIPEKGTLLFPAGRTHVKGKPCTTFNSWSKNNSAFKDTLKDVGDWQLHDLRRTYSSTMAALGVPIHITEKLINHASGTISGVVAVYNRYDYLTEMRDAVATFDNHFKGLLKHG